MPRPKLNPDEVLKLELRITPPDGRPIVDWQLGDDFNMCLAAQEGGDAPISNARLHYHLYIETLRSRSWIIKWIYTIARCNNGESGNAVFFSRKPHDNTIGYVVKSGNIVCRHGCSQTFITDWLNKSEQYVRDKDATRKRQQRVEGSFMMECRKEIAEFLKTNVDKRTPQGVMDFVMNYYITHDKFMPSRTQMETFIVGSLHMYDAYITRSFYLRNFDNR